MIFFLYYISILYTILYYTLLYFTLLYFTLLYYAIYDYTFSMFHSVRVEFSFEKKATKFGWYLLNSSPSCCKLVRSEKFRIAFGDGEFNFVVPIICKERVTSRRKF